MEISFLPFQTLATNTQSQSFVNVIVCSSEECCSVSLSRIELKNESIGDQRVKQPKLYVRYISVTVTYTSLPCDSVHSVVQVFD